MMLLKSVRILLLLVMNSLGSFGQLSDPTVRKVDGFNFQTEDAEVRVHLLRNQAGENELYMANLSGNVCSDSLCRPINIDIYWDLLGNFVDYKVAKGNELTKFDHVELTKEDHHKLHKILSDTNSLLRDYGMNDLVDTSVKVVSQIKVDAVTGATNPTFEGAVVQGAVYTVYTVWHFVNGDVKKAILEYSKKNVFTDAEIRRLLLCDNKLYKFFLIEYIPDHKVEKFEEELIRLISDKDAYIPLYAISKLPLSIWDRESFQQTVLQKLDQYSNPVRISILENLPKHQLSSGTLKNIIKAIPILTSAQLALTFKILDRNRSAIRKSFMNEMKMLLNAPKAEVVQSTTDFLMGL
jgi:hypothetical protein